LVLHNTDTANPKVLHEIITYAHTNLQRGYINLASHILLVFLNGKYSEFVQQWEIVNIFLQRSFCYLSEVCLQILRLIIESRYQQGTNFLLQFKLLCIVNYTDESHAGRSFDVEHTTIGRQIKINR